MRRARSALYDKPQPPAVPHYRVYRLGDRSFGIEVTMADAPPAKITRFPSRAAAQQWIDNHREKIEQQRRPADRLSLFWSTRR
jgi:hypothetical protein